MNSQVDLEEAEWSEWDEEAYLRQNYNTLCQKIDRILSGTTAIDVVGSPTNFPAPAALDGNKVLLNHDWLKRLAKPNDEWDRLAVVLATNMHELGHHQFTPAMDNPIWNKRRAAAWASSGGQGRPDIRSTQNALNILEDQRQELFMSLRYPKARGYYRLTNVRLMHELVKKHGELPVENYLLYYGRRHFLPAPLLAHLRAAMLHKYGPTAVTQSEEIIDEYITIASNEDANVERMWDLAEALSSVFPMPDMQCMPQGTVKSRVKKPQEEIAKKAKEVLDTVDGYGKEEGEAETEEGEEEGESKAEGHESKPKSEPKSKPIDDLKDYIDELDEKSQERIQEDVDEKMDALDASYDSDLGSSDRSRPLPANYLPRARQLSALFKNIAQDLQLKEWRNQRKGHLDVRRIATCIANNSNRMFRHRQRDLTDNARMAVAVSFDVSGSMGHNAHVAMEAALSVAKAVELAGHIAKIESFSNRTYTIKNWRDRKYDGNVLGWGGGTDPLKGFQKLHRDFEAICNAEDINNKVFIIITDGQWEREVECYRVLNLLRKKLGVKVYVIGINYEPKRSRPVGEYQIGVERVYVEDTLDKVCADGQKVITNIDDLLPTMKELLKRLARDIAEDVKRRLT